MPVYPSAKPMQTLGAARAPYPGGTGGVSPAGGTFGAPPKPMAPPPPQNPTTMGTYGGSTQQTDQMGRVITTTPGATNQFTGVPLGGGSTTIEDPRQKTIDQDFAAYKSKALFDEQQAKRLGAAGGGTGSGSGGGGGAGGDGGGLSKNEIMDILDKLAPSAPPQREQAPGLLEREADPEAVASPAVQSQGFARAKDASGRIANAALRNLRSEMVSRGIEGSGIEGQLAGNILGETARGVADAKFNQERAAEDQQWEARKLGYQGRLGQRAGDMGFTQGNYQIGVGQRGQDIDAAQGRLSLAPTILSMLGRARY